MKKIGEIVKSRRKELGISQSALAVLANISIGTVYKFERGESNPTLDKLQKIAEVLGMEIILKVKGDES